MQLMPATSSRFGVLAAYNAGENAVIKQGFKVPPFKETQDYVVKVLRIYNQ